MKKENKLGVLNAGYSADVYKSIPCSIGYKYVRLHVDGSVLGCCGSQSPLGSLKTHDFRAVWFSDAYAAFRQKTASIHERQFHLHDPDWAFCQQCPHIGTNVAAAVDLGLIKRP